MKASPVEPDSLLGGLRWAPIVRWAVLDIVISFVVSLGLVVYMMGGAEFLSEDEETTSQALDQAMASSDFLLWSLVIGLLVTVYAGYRAAREAGVLHLRHGGWTAALSMLAGVAVFLLPDTDEAPVSPDWYDALSLVLIVPAGVFGGWLASRRDGFPLRETPLPQTQDGRSRGRFFAKAPFAQRLNADTVDGLVGLAIVILPMFAVEASRDLLPPAMQRLGIVGIPLGLAYVVLRDVALPGASLGKYWVGLRVIDLRTGMLASRRRSALRNLLDPIPFLNAIDFFVACTDTHGRKFLDRGLKLQLTPNRGPDLTEGIGTHDG